MKMKLDDMGSSPAFAVTRPLTPPSFSFLPSTIKELLLIIGLSPRSRALI